jgi:hypothetical protein
MAEETTHIRVRVPNSMMERLREAAERSFASTSSETLRALDYYLTAIGIPAPKRKSKSSSDK